MASNKELVYTITVKTQGPDGEPVEKQVEKVAKSTKDYEAAISQLKDKMNSATLGGDEWKKLNKELGDAEKKFEKAKLKAQSFSESMSAIPGPIGGISQGVKGLGQTFKVLLANPVVAFFALLAGAVMGLYKAFTSTKEGGEKMERIFAGISAAMDVLRDKVLKLFSSWDSFTEIFTLDFWKDTAKEIENEAKQAAALTGQMQKLDDAERELAKSRAATNVQIADAKLKINDENLSLEQRLKALEEIRAEEIKLAAEEENLARQRYEAIKAQNALSDSSKEALDKEKDAYIAMQNAILASKGKQKELFDQEKALRDRQRNEAKAAAAERKAQAKAVADFEQKINLELITDAEEKATKQLEINRDAQLAEINELKTTAERKAELRLKVEQDYQNKLAAQEKAAQDILTKQAEDAEKERIANEEKLKQEALAAEQRRLDAAIQLINVTNEQELENLRVLLEKKMNMELSAANLSAEERALIEKTYTDQIQAANDNLIQMNKDVQTAKVQAASDGLGQLSEILGKETKAGKAAAIGQALVNTYLGVSQTLGNKTVLPEPFGTIAKIVQSAAILGAGLKSVQEIRGVDTNVPKYAGGGVMGMGTSRSDSNVALLSNGESVINSNSTAMFGPLLSAINQIGGGRKFSSDTLQTSLDTPQSTNGDTVIKTYVVAKDISTQQELDRQVKSRSIF